MYVPMGKHEPENRRRFEDFYIIDSRESLDKFGARAQDQRLARHKPASVYHVIVMSIKVRAH